jgi:hypothetical protein
VESKSSISHNSVWRNCGVNKWTVIRQHTEVTIPPNLLSGSKTRRFNTADRNYSRWTRSLLKQRRPTPVHSIYTLTAILQFHSLLFLGVTADRSPRSIHIKTLCSFWSPSMVPSFPAHLLVGLNKSLRKNVILSEIQIIWMTWNWGRELSFISCWWVLLLNYFKASECVI